MVDKSEAKELDRYVEWWQEAIENLLGWSNHKVSKWLEERRRRSTGLVLHELPAYWILPELIPSDLKKSLESREDGSLVHLIEEIQDVVEDGRGAEWYRNRPYDWATCRQRIDKILGRYGHKLPGKP
jgi:hypothetical protein